MKFLFWEQLSIFLENFFILDQKGFGIFILFVLFIISYMKLYYYFKH